MNRHSLVESLRKRGIKDENVLKAFLKVPREAFVPPHLQDMAYEDTALEIGYGQTISQPYTIGIMLEMLKLKKGLKVLEIGTGSGYTAALIYEITKHPVYSTEIIYSLAERAANTLKKLGYNVSLNRGDTDINIFVRDGSVGLKEYAPFDRIIFHAATPTVPPIHHQLKEGGILVLPLGSLYSQDLVALKREGSRLVEVERKEGFVFVPLKGKYGFDSHY